ncbi:MAG: F0F1 ATP synthase subunit epsilon [Actinomycetia bacterium]|nr:F0F1 ATP synthase subunit epsilon [Actinomycetes bacterium]
MADPLQVDVVAPEGTIWEGDAVTVVARTTEGDIGILSGHEAFMAALVPGAAEVVTPAGNREVIAVEGGFISVFENHVSLLSDSAVMAQDYSLAQARAELAQMQPIVDGGELTDEQTHHYNMLVAQVQAGEKYAALQGH